MSTFHTHEYTVYIPPFGFNVTGTCSKCGGPVLQPMIWSGNCAADEFCGNCGARPKGRVVEKYGPIREMEP